MNDKKYIFYFILFICIFSLNACKPTIGKSNQNIDDETALLAKAMAGQKDIPTKNNPRDKKRIPYIIGDLGGQPVNLPRGAIELLEYEDSPGWDKEKQKTYKPKERTYQSKITSFGFQFRLSDKAIKQYKVTDHEYYQETKFPKNRDHDWMRVSIHSHPVTREHKTAYIHPTNAFDNKMELSTKDDSQCSYVQNEEYNLTLYKNTRQCSSRFYDNDLYIHRDENNVIDTFIYCSNTGNLFCNQEFSLHYTGQILHPVLRIYAIYLLKCYQTYFSISFLNLSITLIFFGFKTSLSFS